MQIHLPKPLRGWRAFAGEVAIIVLGVLIALGFGQVAQAWTDKINADQSRDAIRSEIASNLGNLSLRASTESCITKRLDEIGASLDGASAGKTAAQMSWLGKPQNWNIDTFRWDAASQAGRVSLLPTSEQSNYSDIYGLLKEVGAAEPDEQQAWAQLRSLEGQRRVSATMADTLRMVLSEARYADWHIRQAYGQLREAAHAIGIEPIVDPQYPGQSSVCLASQTPRSEALRKVNSRWGSP